LQFPNVEQKDAVVVALMQALLAQVTGGSFDIASAIGGSMDSANEGRVLMWSSETDEQKELEQFGVGGMVPEDPRPWVATAINNSGPNKLDAFLASSVDYTADVCGGTSTVTVTLANNAATSGPEYVYGQIPGQPVGTNRSWVAVYGPVGASFESARIDGKKQYVYEGYERGHPVWRYNLITPSGGTTTLSLAFTSPANDQEPVVSAQAMAIPQVTSVTSQCSTGK